MLLHAGVALFLRACCECCARVASVARVLRVLRASVLQKTHARVHCCLLRVLRVLRASVAEDMRVLRVLRASVAEDMRVLRVSRACCECCLRVLRGWLVAVTSASMFAPELRVQCLSSEPEFSCSGLVELRQPFCNLPRVARNPNLARKSNSRF